MNQGTQRKQVVRNDIWRRYNARRGTWSPPLKALLKFVIWLMRVAYGSVDVNGNHQPYAAIAINTLQYRIGTSGNKKLYGNVLRWCRKAVGDRDAMTSPGIEFTFTVFKWHGVVNGILRTNYLRVWTIVYTCTGWSSKLTYFSIWNFRADPPECTKALLKFSVSAKSTESRH